MNTEKVLQRLTNIATSSRESEVTLNKSDVQMILERIKFLEEFTANQLRSGRAEQINQTIPYVPARG